MDMIRFSLQSIHHLAVYGIWDELLDDIKLMNRKFIEVMYTYSLSTSRTTPSS